MARSDERIRRWRDGVHRAASSPLAWILTGSFLIRVVGIGWGLPGSDGWDNDGIAPRDFLPGLVESFTPGSYFTYPPAHLLLLTLATLPVTLVALAKAPSLSPADVIQTFIAVPTMTAMSLIARLVTLAMSLGIVWAMAKIVEEVRSPRAGWCAAAVLSLNPVFTYYAHTTNLDVPYLFWGVLALLALTRAIVRHEPSRLRHFALCAALSIGSKDQAYGLFLFSVPCAFALWAFSDAWGRSNRGAIARAAFTSGVLGAFALFLVDGALTNPSGFRKRLEFLSGPASQDFAQYTNDAAGRLLASVESVASFSDHYPWVLAPLVFYGLISLGRRNAHRIAAMLPLLVALSFTLAFNLVARRVEHRFVLPQMIMWGAYAGVGIDALFSLIESRTLRAGASLAIAATTAWALYTNLNVDAAFVLDPRYNAETWLIDHVSRGDVVETHGLNVYLPRFSSELTDKARVTRVGPSPVKRRNPLPNVEEISDDYSHIDARHPRWIVVPEAFAARFLDIPRVHSARGRVEPSNEQTTHADSDGASFFQGLMKGERGYRLVHTAEWTSRLWPRINIHMSTGHPVWIFERE